MVGFGFQAGTSDNPLCRKWIFTVYERRCGQSQCVLSVTRVCRRLPLSVIGWQYCKEIL